MTSDLLVKEIYTTLQGEGPSMGCLAVFVRLSGCSLRCHYCDSEFAFSGGKQMGVGKIIEEIQKYDLPLVVITGGEPLDQQLVWELAQECVRAKFQVEIETGGHHPLQQVSDQVRYIVDIKTPGSGMAKSQNWENLAQLRSNDVLKIVITDRDDYLWVRDEIRDKWQSCSAPIWLSPAFPVTPQEGFKISHPGLSPEVLANWILEDKLPVRLQLQQHRLLWDQVEQR